ncbi:MAG: hypothetical protein PVI59_01100 [Anaerolineae bacterium]|jgi:hypothetical protein
MRKRSRWILLGVLTLLALTPSIAWAMPFTQEGTSGQDALWVTLAPLLAIATVVERVLEVTWDRWEKVGAWPNEKGVADRGDPDYVMQKKLRSHWLGTALAIIVIGLTNVRFFRLLGFDVLFSDPRLQLFDLGIGGIFDEFTLGTLVDWLATAAVVGWGGTELTHSIIEGLVKGRNLWKEMQEVQEGRRSILDARFFSDFIAPKLEEKGISVAQLRQAFETLRSVGVSPDELIGKMTVGQADQLLDELAAQPEKAEAARAIRNLLEGVPEEKQAEIPNVLDLLTPEQRRRFLGI